MISLISGAVLTILLLGGAPARPGPTSPRTRDDASKLAAARARDEAAHAQVKTLERQQAAWQDELDRLGAEEAQLKQSGGHAWGGGKLQADLRRSQTLSSELGGLSRDLASARSAVREADHALIAALDVALASARAVWATTKGPEERTKAAGRISLLRAERDRLSALLPPVAVPKLSTATSEDPRAMRARADALLDEADQIASRLGRVKSRIHELRAEADLQRRMSDFASEQSLFDERDRSLRVVRTSSGNVALDDGTQATAAPTPTTAPTAPGPVGTPATPVGAPGPVSAPEMPSAPPVRGSEDPRGLGAPVVLNGPLSDDLDALEQERTRLEQQEATLRAQAKSVRAAADPR